MSGRTNNGTNENNTTKKHVWHQNEDYVGGAANKYIHTYIDPHYDGIQIQIIKFPY